MTSLPPIVPQAKPPFGLGSEGMGSQPAKAVQVKNARTTVSLALLTMARISCRSVFQPILRRALRRSYTWLCTRFPQEIFQLFRATLQMIVNRPQFAAEHEKLT